MILADTSVWIEHLRKRSARLATFLQEGLVMMHPFVLGELACGNLRNRREVLRLLSELPSIPVASDSEVLDLIERRRLAGRGIGYVDAHLLASTLLTGGAPLWTLDRRFAELAGKLGIAFEESGG